MRCYPNPFNNILTINIQSASMLPAKATIYDMQGILLLETVISNPEESMSTELLLPGAYVLMLTTETDIFYYNLIKIPK